MNIPIFRIIEDIPQFKSIMDLLEGVVIIDSNLSIKSKLFNKIYKDLKDKKYYIDEYIQKGILSFIDGLMIVDYFKQNRTVLPIEKGTETLNDHSKPIDYEDKVEFSTPTGIKSFKYVFENVIIPKLKEGIYYDGEK